MTRSKDEDVGTGIRDIKSGSPMDWGEIFFILHKHCNLNKFDIMNYTLPQVVELVKKSNKYIQFEVETRMSPFIGFGTGIPSEQKEDSEFQEATEEDIRDFINILGG